MAQFPLLDSHCEHTHTQSHGAAQCVDPGLVWDSSIFRPSPQLPTSPVMRHWRGGWCSPSQTICRLLYVEMKHHTLYMKDNTDMLLLGEWWFLCKTINGLCVEVIHMSLHADFCEATFKHWHINVEIPFMQYGVCVCVCVCVFMWT